MDEYGYEGAPWYSDRSDITSVVIGSDVTTIGSHAFYMCTNLTSVVIPNSVTTIGYYAFGACISLTNVLIPNSVTSIGNVAFADCYSLTSITIPNSVTYIGDGTFAYCYSLTSIVIPDSVTTIRGNTFLSCTGLTSVTIPNSVTSVGFWAFNGCTSLTSVTIPNSVTDIGFGSFTGSGLTSVTIPNSVTTIGEGVFLYCANLTSVTISDKVTAISSDAFNGCTSLTSITIPDSVTAIDLFAFNGCTNLKSVTVTGGLNNGTVVSGGVIDTYFKKGAANNWILSYAPDAAESLILRDIGSKNYNPNDTGLGRGIEGDAGRELYYSDGAKYTWNSGTLKWDINKYAVTLTPETGISGFRYSIDGALSIFSSGFFYVPHGSDLTVTAVLSDGYAFVSWSEDSVSKVNQLTISDISGPVNLTANGGLVEQYLTSHYVTFGSGSNYTVYANGSPVSSPVRVTGGGSLSFTVQTSEGYSASPNIEGIAGLIKQSDGSYLIQNVHSNLNVTITVSADSGSGSNSGNGNGSESDSDGDGSDNGGDSENSNGSDNGNDNGSGNSNSSGGDSAVIPYWVPVLISAAFLAAIAWIFFFFKRRKDDEEEENSS